MEKKTTAFACVFIVAMGTSMYIGYRWKDRVAKAVTDRRVADVAVEAEEKVSLFDKEESIASIDSGVQVSPSTVDAEAQTDELCRDFEDIAGEEVPAVYIPPNGWLEKIWG